MSAHVQGDNAWSDARAGQINASSSIVWEDKHPFLAKEQAVREAVRALQEKAQPGTAPSEFKMNPAVQHGLDTEDEAIAFYEKLHGVKVTPSQSVPHSDYMFLRASPDGLIPINNGLEIKCPFNTDQTYSVFDPGKEMYLWQCYTQIEVCGFDYVDFLCYISPDNYHIDRVLPKENFLLEKVSAIHLPQPREGEITRIDLWHSWFNHIQNEFQDPVLRKRHIDPVNPDTKLVTDDDDIKRLDTLSRRLLHLKSKIKEENDFIKTVSKEIDELKNIVADRYQGSVTNNFVTVKVIKKKPPVDWESAFYALGGAEALIKQGKTIEDFRKSSNNRQVSVVPNKEESADV